MIIMSVNKTIVFIIAASWCVFGVAQADDTSITLHEYTGRWYTIGATMNISITAIFSCDWTDITRGNRSPDSYDEVGETIINGVPQRNAGDGSIVDSVIHVEYPKYNATLDYTVTKYNNGKEMILHSQSDETYHILLSRKPTAKNEAREALKNLARSGYRAHDVIHDNSCSY